MARTFARHLTLQALLKVAPETPVKDRFTRFMEAALAENLFHAQDEFMGPTLDSNKWTVGNGGGAAAASPVISAGLRGGQIVAVTGTAGDNTASSIITGGRNFTGDGNSVFTARLNINSAVTNVKVEAGFRDSILTTAGNGNLVATMATPTFNTNYTADGAVWCYDTTNALGWQGLGVAAGTAATGGVFASGIAPVADTFQTLVVALMDGLGFFAILDADHNEIITSGSVGITGAVTKTTLLAPYVYVEARSATSKTVAIDRIHAWGARTTT